MADPSDLVCDDGTVKLCVRQFEKLDKDKNGFITKEEMQKFIDESSMPNPKPKAEDFIKLKDTDGDGKISLKESISKLYSYYGGVNNLRSKFQAVDLNKDGKISQDELIKFVENANKCPLDENKREVAKKICQDMDLDGDGYLDVGEFIRLLVKKDLQTL